MSVKLTEKQELFALGLFTIGSLNFGNGAEAYKAAYPNCKSDNAARVQACRLLTNANVIARKEQIQAEVKVKYEHNRDIAITGLYSDLAHLEKQALAGNIQAIQARTAIRRELSAISGLHKADAAAQAMQINISLPSEPAGDAPVDSSEIVDSDSQ